MMVKIMKKLVRPFLSEKQTKVLKLRMTQDQIAEVLKISRDAVANLKKELTSML